MDRSEALAFLQNSGYSTVFTSVRRTADDTVGGFGPALDRAYAIYNATLGVVGVVDTDDAYAEPFGWLLTATALDLVLPAYAIAVDFSVDAPLSNMKTSQAYRALRQLRDDAWSNCDIFAPFSNAGGFKLNLDFKEPGGWNNGAEF